MIGDQATQAELNASLLNIAQQARQVMDLAREFYGDITNNPATQNAAALEALGFTTNDAAAFLNTVNYLGTVSGVWFGTATQGTDFDFDTAVAQALGGTLTP